MAWGAWNPSFMLLCVIAVQVQTGKGWVREEEGADGAQLPLDWIP